MPSFFDNTELQSLIDRIRQLRPDTPAQWGKMNVSQMLVHAQQPLKVSNGSLQLKRGLIGWLFGKMALRGFTRNEAPFQRNLATDPNFIVKDQPEFEKSRTALIELLQQVSQAGPEGLTKDPHPFFGLMTPTEWDILLWKHMDHHLRQFGV